MWAHQYIQQANQIVCKISEDRIYTDNREDANIFGLEPNFGCCTANMHQGWPKFCSHLWMATPDDGLAAVVYAPCEIHTQVKGQRVRLEVRTEYPFNEEIRISVLTQEPLQFPLKLRIPEWADGAEVQLDGRLLEKPLPGTFYTIDNTWKQRHELVLRLPMQVRTQRRLHDSIAIERGPLIYSLKIGEDWRRIAGELPHADWEVYPTTNWNYALALNAEAPEQSISFTSKPAGDCPFSPEGAPIRARVKGKLLADWTIQHNAATPPPQSPITSSKPLEELELIPYGCTNLRITEFPVFKE
jgi:hypothetical protein